MYAPPSVAAKHPAINGNLFFNVTPKIAGSDIPKRTDPNDDMQICFVLSSFHFKYKYHNTDPPCAINAIDIKGIIKFLPVSAIN